MTCSECGRPVPYAGRGPHPTSCPGACRQRAWRRSRAHADAAEVWDLLQIAPDPAPVEALAGLPEKYRESIRDALRRLSGETRNEAV
jgi:hypothetical protein